MVVFDLRNRDSFNSCNKWYEVAKQMEIPTIILVGNKMDEEEKREVSLQEAHELAASLGTTFHMTRFSFVSC